MWGPRPRRRGCQHDVGNRAGTSEMLRPGADLSTARYDFPSAEDFPFGAGHPCDHVRRGGVGQVGRGYQGTRSGEA